MAAALAAYPWPWELIVVDDGSTDGTGRALDRRARETGSYVRILHLARNFRQTAAMQAGIDAARGDVIATLDGDGQRPALTTARAFLGQSAPGADQRTVRPAIVH